MNTVIDILLTTNVNNNIYNISGISEIILGDFYIQEYYKILEYGIISFLLCSVLAIIAYIFSLSSIKDTEKLSEYECGFEPFDSATRLPFDVHFYIVGILFLIFDVEIAVLFPWVLGLKFIGWYGYYTMILFLIILTVGFIYEWQRGALNWPTTESNVNKYVLSAFLFTTIDINKYLTSSFFVAINGFSSYTTHLDLLNILGEVFLATFICFGFVFVSVVSKKLDNSSKRVFAVSINNLSILGLILTSIILINTPTNWVAATPLFSMSLIVDSYSSFSKLIIIWSVVFILMSNHYYLISRQNSNPEFSLLVLLATLFLLILVSAFNLFTAFMSIIGFSITLYVLILSDLEHSKREASIKYYYLSVYSSGFLIFGIFLVYLISNSLSYINIKVFLHNLILAINLNTMETFNAQSILVLLTIALLSVLIGILFKLSAFPCHFWAPEVYDGSPTIVMAFFILPVKIAVFAFFLRLFAYVFLEVSYLWQGPLLFVSMASMLWGCICAVNELKIKRFIAYTSINQIGFLLIGIVCNTFAGYQASLIYLFIYIIMNIVFLIIFLNTYNLKTFQELRYFSEFKYIKFTHLTQIFFFTSVIFSMAGIPPFAGFFGKYFLLMEAFNANFVSLVLMALFTSLISAYYYIRIVKICFFETTSYDFNLITYIKGLSNSFVPYGGLFSPFNTNTNYSSNINIHNFYVCLIFGNKFPLPWFKVFHKFNYYIYYTGIAFLIGFLFLTNFMYKGSWFFLQDIFWPLTQNMYDIIALS